MTEKLGFVTAGSLNKGIEVKLDGGASIEDMAVGRYVTIDRWASEDAFRAFRLQHDADYEAVDRSCDALTSAESRIGAFTV